MYKIPLFDLHYGPEETEAVVQTLESKWISMGRKVAEFEEKFAQHLGGAHTLCVANCTSGLFLALRALGIGAGDEVIVPSLSFVATANVVLYAGATPVFADICSYEDFSIDPQEIETKITSRTKAIIVMHYGGFSCPMDEILELAKRHNLYVVGDCAHAPATWYRGQHVGTLGDINVFSFFSNKNITCAEGGLIATQKEEWHQRMKLMRSHGMTTLSYERAKGHATSYDVVELGYNFRIDDIRGTQLCVQLTRLESDVARRKELWEYYLKKFVDVAELLVPYRDFPHPSSHYIAPILLKSGGVERREALRNFLAKKKGVQTSVHYPAIHRFSIYEPYRKPLPKTEFVVDHEITLPLYYSLTEEQIDYIVESLKEGLQKV